MKIVIDYDLCEGNGVCVKIAPEMFALDDDDNLLLKLDDAPTELHAKIEKAVTRCPRQALSIE